MASYEFGIEYKDKNGNIVYGPLYPSTKEDIIKDNLREDK